MGQEMSIINKKYLYFVKTKNLQCLYRKLRVARTQGAKMNMNKKSILKKILLIGPWRFKKSKN